MTNDQTNAVRRDGLTSARPCRTYAPVALCDYAECAAAENVKRDALVVEIAFSNIERLVDETAWHHLATPTIIR